MRSIIFNKYVLLNVIILFVVIYIPSFFVPIQSDDYSYFLKGLSLHTHIAHYLGWSGRFITDYISSLLLVLFPHFVYEALNSLAFTIMCFSVALLPCAIFKKYRKTPALIITLWMIFFTYWLANPNLGQTSFWIVGSANYLWTIMWASVFMLTLMAIYRMFMDDKTIKIYHSFIIAILGLFAGLSNENTGPCIFLFCVFIFWDSNFKFKTSLIGGTFSFIGSTILIAAPGNYIRETYFEYWYSKSNISQLTTHILHRMPDIIAEYWPVYVVMIICLLICRLKHGRKTITDNCKFPILFFALSLIANLILFKAPFAHGRNLNTGLFFLLATVAFSLFPFLYNSKTGAALRSSAFVSIPLILVFLPSYVLFTRAMIHTNVQQSIREKIIGAAKSNGKKTVSIPDWYFTTLLKSSDTFDKYQSPSMRKFYGMKSIKSTPAYFDYSVLKTGKTIPFNKKLNHKLKLTSITGYTAGFSDRVALGFNRPISDHSSSSESVLHIHIYDKKDKNSVNRNIPVKYVTKVGPAYYYDTSSGNISIRDIDHIAFSVSDSDGHPISKKLSVAINEKSSHID